MLPRADSYDDLIQRFRWTIPARFNIARAVCDDWAAATPDAPAVLRLDADGGLAVTSFRQLRRRANRLANALRALGVGRGDAVGILLPQSVEAAEAHVAVHKLGALAVPLFTLFGAEALRFRLADSRAVAVIGTGAALATLETGGGAGGDRDAGGGAGALPDLRHRIAVDAPPPGAERYDALLDRAADSFDTVDTAAEDPAMVIYTSGTTGQPKGARHAHRVLLGHLPGVELPHDGFPRPGDRFWTPADWAWIGGLLDVLLPSLAHGVPVLAHRFRKFDPEAAFDLMARAGVRNAFLPPTALKMLRQVPEASVPAGLAPRSIGSGGESLDAGLLDWGRRVFGCPINEFYGQTECNLIVANNAALMPVKPGSMGRPVPGHAVAVVDAEGQPVAPGETGTIAVRAPDPAMFLDYLNRPEATAARMADGWLLTGDTARADADGYLWFVGRDDDLISSAGYRLGPGEIEAALSGHPAVAMAAVVGVPDDLRGQRVKAFVVPAPGHAGSAALSAELRARVTARVGAHAHPREIAYVDALPLTATGKIKRAELRARG